MFFDFASDFLAFGFFIAIVRSRDVTGQERIEEGLKFMREEGGRGGQEEWKGENKTMKEES